jgi:YggT family protein
MISAVLWLFNTVVILYIVVLIAMMLMSWVSAFSAENRRNPVMAQVRRALYAVTNPLVHPVRRYIPAVGGIDLSPVVVVLLLEFVRRLVNGAAAAGGATA